MTPGWWKVSGHSVTATLKKYAALVPSETSVDMDAVR